MASDLLGLTPVPYDSARVDGNLRAALGSACSKIARAIKDKGIRPERLHVEKFAPEKVWDLPEPEKIIVDKQIGASSFVVINDDICKASTDIIVSSDDNHFNCPRWRFESDSREAWRKCAQAT
jgi:hypothetical protein